MGRKFIGALVAVCVVSALSAVGGFTVARERWASAEAAHLSSRSKAILSQAKQRDWKVVVLGDSMTELAMLNDVCGEQALNAGISGAQAAQLIALAHDLSDVVKPEEFVIAVGTNDSRYGDPTKAIDFERNYRELIVAARKSGARVTLLDIPPAGKFDKASKFNPDLIAEHNRQIRSFGLPVGPAWQGMAGTDGRMPNEFTDDGVHPNAAGYKPWLGAMQSVACKRHDHVTTPPTA